MKIAQTLVIIGLLLSGIAHHLYSQTAEEIFQFGLQKEVGEGNLEEAIDLFNSLLENDMASRNLKAQALLHVGACYQKLGRIEATKAYEQIIQDYAEQREIANIARSRLEVISTSPEVEEIPSGPSLQQMWAGKDVDITGSISPSGKLVSYSDWDSGNLGIKDLSTGLKRNLTNDGTYNDPMHFTICSTISPDGEKVAYSWYNDHDTYDVKIVEIDDPNPKMLYCSPGDEAYPISWSPDGNNLLIRQYDTSSGCQIIVLDINTNNAMTLKHFDSWYWMRASYSHDNKYVAYDLPVTSDKKNYDIHLISSDGREEFPLVEHPANDRVLGWDPGTGDFLFISDRTGTWDVWLQNVKLGKKTGDPVKLIPGIGFVSPLGNTKNNGLYYGIVSRKFNSFLTPIVETSSLDTNNIKPLLGSINYVEFSPVCDSIVFIKEMIGSSGPGWYFRPLILMDMKTGEEAILLKDFECRHPRWSNDGSTILFSGYDIGGETSSDYYGGIYEIDVTSKNVREVVLFSDTEYFPDKTWNQCLAEWSNDKEKIYYIDASGIKQKDLSTSQVRSILEDKSLGSVLDISLVHDMLLFTSVTNNTQNSTLKIYSPVTGETIDIYTTQKGKEIGSAVWSQDGEHVFFSENKQNKSEIWCLNISTRELRKVWSASNQNSSLSIDSESNNLVASFFMQEFEVWRLKNLILANQIED